MPTLIREKNETWGEHGERWAERERLYYLKHGKFICECGHGCAPGLTYTKSPWAVTELGNRSDFHQPDDTGKAPCYTPFAEKPCECKDFKAATCATCDSAAEGKIGEAFACGPCRLKALGTQPPKRR